MSQSNYDWTSNISSRYSVISLSGNNYDSLPLAKLKNGTLSEGYIYAPYVIADISSEWYKYYLRQKRIEKLKKINKL